MKACKVLTGVRQGKNGPGPFKWAGTCLYNCSEADDAAVAKALVDLAEVLIEHSSKIDFVGVMLACSKAK